MRLRQRADFHVCVRAGSSTSRPRALAAGVTWRLVITSAPWAARGAHTSVIDSAGTIYVIGGIIGIGIGGNSTCLNDVWISADGGAGFAGLALGGFDG